MTFFMFTLAGMIGAGIIAEFWPQRAVGGSLNLGFGIVGGGALWAAALESSRLEPAITSLMLTLALGALGGAMVTMGAGSLRNILSRHPVRRD